MGFPYFIPAPPRVLADDIDDERERLTADAVLDEMSEHRPDFEAAYRMLETDRRRAGEMLADVVLAARESLARWRAENPR